LPRPDPARRSVSTRTSPRKERPVKTIALPALPALLILVPGLALAQSAATPAPAAPVEHAMLHAAQTPWGDAPPALPRGAQAAVVYGDPGQAGAFVLRLKAPAGYKVPRHWHPSAELVTIIEGDFHLSMGEAGNAHEADFGPGDFVSLPAQMQHEASTKNGAVVQVTSTGPFEIHYVDPKDDPRSAAK